MKKSLFVISLTVGVALLLGAAGVAGAVGAAGSAGAAGAVGAKGDTGAAGAAGKDGKGFEDCTPSEGTTCDGPGGGGSLYAKKDQTFDKVFATFRTSVSGAPALTAANAFFTVNVSSGACPSWSFAIDYLRISVDVGQFFCNSGSSEMMRVAGYALLLGAAFIAWRIAFL